MTDCIYRGKEEGILPTGEPVFLCKLNRKNCCLTEVSPNLLCCETCKSRLTIDHPDFAKRWQDPLIVTDRVKTLVDCLRGLLANGKAFLLCGGPSAASEPLERLGGRGFFSLAVNNMAGHPRLKPQAFVCSDPPCKFSHSIWLDPGIMKFVPTPKLGGKRGRLHRKDGEEFIRMQKSVCECPNVWGFQRDSYLTPDEGFFTSNGACWGNHNAGVEKTGEPKTVCTMLLGLRLLYYLGARRIFLVGVDFSMTPESGYSFAQGRDQGASNSNNEHYRIVNDWLCRMVSNGTFAKFGLQVFNCNQYSSLRAFPHVSFEDALTDARGYVEEMPDLSNWYDDSKSAIMEDKCDVSAL